MVMVGSNLAGLVEYEKTKNVLRREGRGVDLNLRDGLQDLTVVVVARRQYGAGPVLKEGAAVCHVVVQAKDGIRDYKVTGVQTCALPIYIFFSSRRRHTRLQGDWSSDVCSSD